MQKSLAQIKATEGRDITSQVDNNTLVYGETGSGTGGAFNFMMPVNNALANKEIFYTFAPFSTLGTVEENLKAILNMYKNDPSLYKKTVTMVGQIWAFSFVTIQISYNPDYQDTLSGTMWLGSQQRGFIFYWEQGSNFWRLSELATKSDLEWKLYGELFRANELKDIPSNWSELIVYVGIGAGNTSFLTKHHIINTPAIFASQNTFWEGSANNVASRIVLDINANKLKVVEAYLNGTNLLNDTVSVLYYR